MDVSGGGKSKCRSRKGVCIEDLGSQKEEGITEKGGASKTKEKKKHPTLEWRSNNALGKLTS
jgi:hypothetical protein